MVDKQKVEKPTSNQSAIQLEENENLKNYDYHPNNIENNHL